MRYYQVGDWAFDAESGELHRGGDRRRLEPRAARTLQLLVEAGGAIVPHNRIIDEVWGGRSLSDNSIPVVIGQLRKLLGDNARSPRLIETVPKRGYRLIGICPPGSAETGLAGSVRARWPIVLTIIAVVIAAIWLVSNRAATGPSIAIIRTANETGVPGLDPHVRATSELIVNEISRRGFRVRRQVDGADLLVASKLVMWNGEPYLSMTAIDDQGVILWSAMTKGNPAAVPAAVAAEIDRLETKLAGQ